MIMARGGPGVEVDMAKRAGQIKRVASQKRVQVNQFAGRVDLYFLHDFIYIYIYIYKENNLYLPFGKSCNKLLDVKCITLNLPLILRMNSIKLINTYSIILKLYKSQHC